MILYIDSINKVQTVYSQIRSWLGDAAYSGVKSLDNRLLNMFHSATDPATKTYIIDEFTRTDIRTRLLICTSAFGTGIDIPDVDIVLMWGAPHSLFDYWQLIGRGGRNSQPTLSVCYLYKASLSNAENFLDLTKCYRRQFF